MSSYFKGGWVKNYMSHRRTKVVIEWEGSICCETTLRMQKSNDRECCALKCNWHKYFLMKSLSNFTNISPMFSIIFREVFFRSTGKKLWEKIAEEIKGPLNLVLNIPLFCQRSIFQIFWKLHCFAKFFLFELETSNFGYLLIF